MINKVSKFIDKKSLCKSDNKLLVAISGGADSVALFLCLNELNYDVDLAHCNFNLRGDESDNDEEFVKQLADKFGVRLHLKSFDTQKYADENKVSIQMAARDLRYKWFNELLVDNNLNYIAVGHHKNDDVETFFINLTRGSGLKGLLGIKTKNNNIIRPLLCVSRLEIEAYLSAVKQSFREDSSNKSVKYLRNKIRYELIPLLTEMNPNIQETISNEIEILEGVFQVFEEQIESKRKEILQNENGIFKLKITDVQKLNPLNIYLYEFLNPYGFSEVNQIIKALNTQSGKQFFSKTYQLNIDREYILISKISKENVSFEILENQHKISTPFTMELSKSIDRTVSKDRVKAKLDFDKLQFPLVLRKWKKGDKFMPLGMRTFKKLSDFFIDEKYSLISKQQQWILCSADDIIWIVGDRIDDRFKITPQTKNVYIAELLNEK
jgi:tRNA(Ile)-lysidine synthase